MNLRKLSNWKNALTYRQKVAGLMTLGVIVGLAGLFAYLLRMHTYIIGDDPAACVNCHIMTPYYATWSHSSHGRDATCNDCHVPHQNLFMKYYFKGKDQRRGSNHQGRRRVGTGHHGQLHTLPHTAEPGTRKDGAHGLHDGKARRGPCLLGMPQGRATRGHEQPVEHAPRRDASATARIASALVATKLVRQGKVRIIKSNRYG